MSMNCQICRERFSLSNPEPDINGAIVFMCIACAAQHARPRRFPEGTQRTEVQRAMTVGADIEQAVQQHVEELGVATARAEAAVSCLRVMVEQWGREMRGGYSTPQMQWALRRAKELIG